MTTQKQIHSLIVDTGPLIRNTISISTIINAAENIYTTPAIISEIRDPATRSRVETTLLPFLKIRTPTPASYDHVAQFSKKTGDFAVLSRQDLGILALAYEIEQETRKDQEKSGGAKNEASNAKGEESKVQVASGASTEQEKNIMDKEITQASELETQTDATTAIEPTIEINPENIEETVAASLVEQSSEITPTFEEPAESVHPLESEKSQLEASEPAPVTESLEEATANLNITSEEPEQEASPSLSEDDSEGEWITPSNIKKHQAKDSGVSLQSNQKPRQTFTATMTTDYAMQNVLLQLHLTLLSPQLQRIKKITSHILRCHACFLTTKEMTKQFCPRCGQPALNRVACSTNAKGKFQIHLAKNYQWNNRGNRYSVPKPVAGTASGKGIRGGGQGGWGNGLVLSEDQKEYTRRIDEDKRTRTRDLMDEDYLPGILTGDRGRAGGRPKVGAGRNVNSKKRH